MFNAKPGLVPSIQVGSGGVDAEALRDAALADKQGFALKAQELIAKGEMRWEKVRSLPRLFHALSGIHDIKTTAEVAGVQCAVMASAFPLLAGGMTIAAFNERLAAVPAIGGELVEERQDNKKITTIAAATAMDVQIDRVDEGKEFPEISASEERYEIRHLPNGRRLSITAEMISENDVAGIVDKINTLAEIAGNKVETQTLRRVCDIDGSATSPAEPYVLRRNGSGAALYTTSTSALPGAPSGTRINSNTLADGTDLENARVVLAAMKNDMGERVALPMSECILLVPDALVSLASTILGSENTPGVLETLNQWGPRGQFRPKLMSSPRLDDLSTTAWYLGAFKRQFVRKWKLAFEYVTLGMDTESFLRSRIAFQARIAWDCEIGARAYQYVVQNLTSTTAP